MEIGNFTEKKAFKIDYSKLRKAVLECELDKSSQECKKMLKDLNIEVYD